MESKLSNRVRSILFWASRGCGKSVVTTLDLWRVLASNEAFALASLGLKGFLGPALLEEGTLPGVRPGEEIATSAEADSVLVRAGELSLGHPLGEAGQTCALHLTVALVELAPPLHLFRKGAKNKDLGPRARALLEETSRCADEAINREQEELGRQGFDVPKLWLVRTLAQRNRAPPV